MFRFYAVIAFAITIAGCPGPMQVCTPGATQACACGGGLMGAQTCNGSGSGFGACVNCPGTDAGAGDAGTDGGVNCGTHATCDTCTPVNGCGWCGASRSCIPISTCEMPSSCGGRWACRAAECAAVARAVGIACTNDSECYPDGRCLRASSGYWPGGYCDYGCTIAGQECGPAAVCIPSVLNDGTGSCAPACSVSTDCRPGYFCWTENIRGQQFRSCQGSCRNNPAERHMCGANRCGTDTGLGPDLCGVSCASGTDAECSPGSHCGLISRFQCSCTSATDCGPNGMCYLGTGRCGCANDAYCSSAAGHCNMTGTTAGYCTGN